MTHSNLNVEMNRKGFVNTIGQSLREIIQMRNCCQVDLGWDIIEGL